MKGMTLFSGFGGADIGMTAAGIEIVAGIEYDAAIAEVARANGHPVTVADVRHVNPADYMGIDVLHSSPVCTRASVANNSAERDEETGLKEAALDIECAQATANFITALHPKIFTLENVWGYRKFKSWRLISDTLDRLGYWWTIDHVNCADFGVPQTRKRMIVRAIKGGWVPPLPEPEPWIGWYEAIEDLIPGLPESQFAPWQLERLPAELSTLLMAGGGNTNFEEAHPGKGARLAIEPSHTVTTITKDGGAMPRAFLVNTNQSGDDGDNIRIADVDRPAFTTTPSADGRMRAYLLGNGSRSELIPSIEPADTLTANRNQSGIRAFLVPGGNANSFSIREQDEPARTIEDVNRVGNIPRAFLVDGVNSGNFGKLPTVRDGDAPSVTVTSNQAKGFPRAWLSQGRVVKMTPRALARFQTFPDSYMLPDKAALACKGIGNAVPCLLMEKVYRQLVEAQP